MSTREKGKIASARIDEDHGHHTVWLMIEFEGSGQGFGGLALGPPEKGTVLLDDYVESLCATFGVSELKRLVGKECFALRCFDINNEPIEGLEAMDGRRFTHTAWRKKHFPDSKDPLASHIESLRSTVSWAERRKQDALRGLETARRDYVEWK